jgi:hypothetical protein
MVRMNEQESRRDHLRRGPALSFFLSRAAAQPATASEVIASRTVALVPVTGAVKPQTTLGEVKRASRAWWRFAAFGIATSLVVVAGTFMYFRGEVAYEATIRKAAEAKAAKAHQERDHAAAMASELATIRRDFDTPVALRSKAADEAAELRNAVETKTAEPTQERDHAAALANNAPAAAAPVAAPARKLDPDELATLMDRAKRFIAAGDISPARLLLERAADAQEPTAALMLALTFDPDVLGTQNSRNIISDPAMARVWYQRATQLGSADAQRRLSESQK